MTDTPDPHETVAQLRERIARLEGEHDAVRDRLERGAGTMDDLRQAIAQQASQAKRTADADRIECRQTFGALRKELETSSAAIASKLAPKPWTLKRALGWAFGAGVPVFALVGAIAMWLLGLRDTTRDAAAGLESAAQAIKAIRGDMRTMETRQAETAGAMKALHDGQSRAEDKLDRLLGRIRPKKDEE